MATRKELLEQYEEAQFALLMDELMELQGAEMHALNEKLKHDPATAVPPEVREHSMQTINQAYDERDKQKKARRLKTTIRTLLIAAVLGGLLLTTVSADFKAAAKNFIYELTELAAELMFDFGDDSAETESQGEVIMGYYIPALPEEFELVDATETAHSVRRKYLNEDGFVMIRVVEDDGSGLDYHVDAENMDVSRERMNSFEVLVVEQNGYIQFVLSDQDNQKYIEITCTALEMKEMRRFVLRIKNN